MRTGILYGIGVGPGDPELITVKALRILKKADVLFAAASSKNNESLAAKIVSPYLSDSTQVRMLPFPMTRDSKINQFAWEKNTMEIIATLKQGKDAVFVTLGDCLTYSTFGYILKNIKRISPEIIVRSIPGITSYQAAASRLNMPLVEGDESLVLLSGVCGGDRFRAIAGNADNVVFLKAYRNARDIVDAIDESDTDFCSVGVVRCGQEDEQIIHDIQVFKDKKPDYWSLIISKKDKKGVTEEERR